MRGAERGLRANALAQLLHDRGLAAMRKARLLEQLRLAVRTEDARVAPEEPQEDPTPVVSALSEPALDQDRGALPESLETTEFDLAAAIAPPYEIAVLEVAASIAGASLFPTPHADPAFLQIDQPSLGTNASPRGTEPRSGSPTVADVLAASDLSGRLGNCLGKNRGVFSAWLAKDAVSLRQAFRADILKRCANLGAKTAAEVAGIVDRYANAHWPLSPTDDQVGREAHIALPREPDCLDETVGSILRRSELSTRLDTIVRSGALDAMLARDIVLDKKRARRCLLDIKNSGRKTADEAVALVLAYVDEQQSPTAISDFETDGDEAVVGGGPDDPLFRTLIATRRGASADRLLLMYDRPREWCRELVSSMSSDKEHSVLIARYGLDGTGPKTLQDIASSVHVTRERVRQVEAKGLKRLAASAEARAAFDLLLAREGDDAWRAMADGAPIIQANALSHSKRKLDPIFLLGVDVRFGAITTWLDTVGFRTSDGWFRSEVDASRRTEAGGELRALFASHAMPMPHSTAEALLGRPLDASEFVGNGWTSFEGYLHTGHLGSKARRTIRMHQLAGECAVGGLFDIGTLAHLYRERFPSDECGSRMFQMQANEAPHLFASLFDGVWLRLPAEAEPQRLPAPPFERRDLIAVDEFEAGSIGQRITQRLTDAGPEKLGELREFMAGAGVNYSSIGAVLISNPCFRRVAPGTYALYRGDAELRARLRPKLLDERHCRAYCHARHGGAPLDYYAAWGAEFERDLAVWAQKSAPTELFRSLMSVAEPENWPIPAETLEQIRRIQTREACWLLGAPMRRLGHRFMDEGQFFAILIHLAVFGWISWFAVNRTCGVKSDAYDAVDILAFLVMADLVEAPGRDWQGRHEATPLAVDAFFRAAARLHRHGTLSWSDLELAPLLPGLEAAAGSGARAWVDADEFLAAVSAWRSGELRTGKAYEGHPQETPIDVDDLFDSPDWDAAFA